MVEEAAEVQQVIGKLIATRGEEGYWDGSNLRERLEDEIGDLLAALEFVQRHCNLDTNRIDLQQEKKLEGFEVWHLKGDKVGIDGEVVKEGEEADE